GAGAERVDLLISVVPVHVATQQLGDEAAAVDVAADDRGLTPGDVVEERIDALRGRVARGRGGLRPLDAALATWPAEVRSGRAARDHVVDLGARHEVDLLARALAHVADPQIAVRAIEGDAPGIP